MVNKRSEVEESGIFPRGNPHIPRLRTNSAREMREATKEVRVVGQVSYASPRFLDEKP